MIMVWAAKSPALAQLSHNYSLSMERIGKYCILRPLAAGGMAQLYLAERAGPMGFRKRLVLKRLYDHLASETDALEMFMNEEDLLVAISSSGKSENILNGAVAAKAKGSKVITLSGFEQDNPLSKLGDINFYSPASHYGIVEVCHQLLCHCILDTLMEVTGG